MHPIARLHQPIPATNVTAIRITHDPAVSAILTSDPISATWHQGALKYGEHSGFVGDYLVQHQDGTRSIIPAAAFARSYEAAEPLPDAPARQARYSYSFIGPVEQVHSFASLHDEQTKSTMPVTINTQISPTEHNQLCAEFPNLFDAETPVDTNGLVQTACHVRVKSEDFVNIVVKLKRPEHPRPTSLFPLEISFRTGQSVVHAIAESTDFIPRVSYQHNNQTILDNQLNAAMLLIANVSSEETDSLVEPRALWTIPIEKLDAIGRVITTSWMHGEPELHYPKPGLAGHLALWGLTVEDLMVQTDDQY